MNDFEFAHKTHPKIGKLYSEAKLSFHLFPKHTLTQTRALASLCCDLLRPDNWTSWPPGLNEKIKVLYKSHKINRETYDKLKALQLWGNWAAHPEESRKEEEDFSQLAKTALDKAIGLLETVFQHKNRGAALPKYEISHDSSDELKNACFRALMENSAEDQYQVAMQLQRDIASKQEQLKKENPLEQFRLQNEIVALVERSLDLLSYANDAGHPPSSYQYGLALSEGARGDTYVNVGINHIRTAAQDGNIDALAWCGQSALYGWHDEPINFELAREYLEKAAAEDHPRALCLLSEMYRDGLGVKVDKKTAYELTLRAAEAGYPQAQYHTFVALWNGDGVEVDEETAITWLQLACDAGFPEAQRQISKFIQLEILPGGFVKAEKLLKDAIKGKSEAHLDLAELYMSRKESTDLVNAAYLVQAAYENALVNKNHAVADKAFQMAPSLVAKLDELIHDLSEEQLNRLIFIRFLFNDHGQPFPNRKEREKKFRDKLFGLHELAKSGSSESIRLIRELTSRMGPKPAQILAPDPQNRHSLGFAPALAGDIQKKVGPYDPCNCGSELKYKFCCYEKHRAEERGKKAFRVGRY